jgi:outer membrane protein W
MRTTKTTSILAVALAAVSTPLTGQLMDSRHQIELRLGVWNQINNVRTEIGSGGLATTVGSSGFLGGLAYGHWLSEAVAVRVSVGGLLARVDTEIDGSGVSSESASVGQILVGARYYFPRSTYGTSMRPFLGAGVGTVIGSQVASRVGTVLSTETRTEPALGGELSAGIDFLLSRHFLTSIGLAYLVMTDFDQPIGGSDNYSGPQLSLGFGYVF